MGLEETTLPSEGDGEGSTTRSTTGDRKRAVEDKATGLDSEAETATSDTATSPASASGESDDEVAEPGWLADPWYRTRAGVAMLLIDVALIVALASVTMTTVVSEFGTVVEPTLPGHVPVFVYVFSALGGLGYVFTALLEDFQSDTKSLFRYNLRVPAALPLGAGVWLLSDVLVGANAAPRLVLGLAFLSGLYVNLAYERLGAVARRFLPDSETTETDAEPETAAGQPSSGEPDSSVDEQASPEDDSPTKRDSRSGTPTD